MIANARTVPYLTLSFPGVSTRAETAISTEERSVDSPIGFLQHGKK
jgi:hypothetical protein